MLRGRSSSRTQRFAQKKLIASDIQYRKFNFTNRFTVPFTRVHNSRGSQSINEMGSKDAEAALNGRFAPLLQLPAGSWPSQTASQFTKDQQVLAASACCRGASVISASAPDVRMEDAIMPWTDMQRRPAWSRAARGTEIGTTHTSILLMLCPAVKFPVTVRLSNQWRRR